MNPHFSVVIPLYNKERYIARAINSVFHQSFVDYEIIVVDDGSTDSGPDIASQMSRQGKLRIVYQRNSGVSSARNKGVQEARAPWIAFLDADDEYLPDFLQRASETIKQYPDVDLVYAKSMFMRDNILLNACGPARNRNPLLLEDYLRYVVFKKGSEIHSSAVAVRKDAFRRAGVFPVGIKIGEDSDMWLRLAWTAKFAIIPEFLSIYHMEAGDSGWEEVVGKDPFWFSTYREWIEKNRIPIRLRKSSEYYYQKYLIDRSIKIAMSGSRRQALQFLNKRARWGSAPKKHYLKAIMLIMMPNSVLTGVKQAKRIAATMRKRDYD